MQQSLQPQQQFVANSDQLMLNVVLQAAASQRRWKQAQ